MILENLKDQGVVSVHKFTRKINQKDVPTGLILLSFNPYKLPEEVNIAWYSIKTREFFPNPMRCKRCQKLGHTTKRCSNAESCDGCNLPPHPNVHCTRTLCANCLGDHQASSKECPRYVQQKEILKLQTQNKCSFAEARKIHQQLNPFDPTTRSSYASTLVNNTSQNVNITVNKNTGIKTTNYNTVIKNPNSISSVTMDKPPKSIESSNFTLDLNHNNDNNKHTFTTRANIHSSTFSSTNSDSIHSTNSSPIPDLPTSDNIFTDAQDLGHLDCSSQSSLFTLLPSLNSVINKSTLQESDSD